MGEKRILKPWTEDEDILIRQGEVPEGRTYNQAATHAYRLGVPWAKLRRAGATAKRWWTDDEKKKLAEGHTLPEGRTLEACRQATRLFNIPVKLPEPTKEDVIRIMHGARSPWPPATLRRLARKYGIAMRPAIVKNGDASGLAAGIIYTRKIYMASPMTRAEYAWLLHASGKSFRDIGIMLGVSKTRACAEVERFASKLAKE